MLGVKRRERQEYLINWLGRLDGEIERLHNVLDDLERKQDNMFHRVRSMDFSLEVHEMDIEYLKANIKKKKGNK
jgi:peptidoglycan hydrolase CwlO-like protein